MEHLTGANPCLTACGWPLRYEQESNLDLRLFLMSDAVTAGLRGQKPGRLQHSANAGDPYRSECTGEIVQNLY